MLARTSTSIQVCNQCTQTSKASCRVTHIVEENSEETIKSDQVVNNRLLASRSLITTASAAKNSTFTRRLDRPPSHIVARGGEHRLPSKKQSERGGCCQRFNDYPFMGHLKVHSCTRASGIDTKKRSNSSNIPTVSHANINTACTDRVSRYILFNHCSPPPPDDPVPCLKRPYFMSPTWVC